MKAWLDRDRAEGESLGRDAWIARFVEQHGESAYRTAYRLLRDRHDAHDVVQDALTAVFRNWEDLRSEDTGKAWFFRILVNRCISRQRRHAVRTRALGLLGIAPPDRTEDPSIAVDVSKRVLPHVLRLPSQQRTAVMLRFGEDRSVQEIAELMNIGTESVKTHLKRGLAELRRQLGATSEDVP